MPHDHDANDDLTCPGTMTDSEFDLARRDLGRRPPEFDTLARHVHDCRFREIVILRHGEMGPAMLEALNRDAMRLAGEAKPLVQILGRRVNKG